MNEHRFAYPTVHEIRRAAKSPAPAMPTQRELVRESLLKVPDQARKAQPDARR